MSLVAIAWNPSPRQLRQFALLGAAALLLAALGPLGSGHPLGAGGLAAAGIGLGAGGVRWPGGVRPLYVGVMAATSPIGWAVSHLVLALIYFGLFTGVALVFRLIGRDALRRRFEPGAASYWQPRRGTEDLRRYFRQF
jgi:hypothetical protein